MKKVNIKGPIISSEEAWIYDYFDIEATSPKSVYREIEAANGEEIEVVINSGGGSVFAGSEIYTALKEYQNNVTVKVVGLAASAASVIAMAGSKVKMSPTAQMMIHNVSAIAGGDYRDMEHTAEILKNANTTIANAYKIKSGMDEKSLLKMMDKETWLTPQQALEHGLIDEIMFENQAPQLVASAGLAGMLPPQVIEKIRNMKSEPQPPVETPKQDNQAAVLMARLQLLKLKG
jgi:ATP-dependent Clp endopeptidase proteolytic subunit ClpP